MYKIGKNTDCILILHNPLHSDTNINNEKEMKRNILIDGGRNTFNKLIILGFYNIDLKNIETEFYLSHRMKPILYTRTPNSPVRICGDCF